MNEKINKKREKLEKDAWDAEIKALKAKSELHKLEVESVKKMLKYTEYIKKHGV